MLNRRGIFGLVAGILIAAAPVLADSLTLVTSKTTQAGNDSINWSQLGADATSLTASFPATSTEGLSVTCGLAGSGSLTSVVCPETPCSWAGVSSGMSPGDELIWTADTGNSGNGPLTLTFSSNIGGGGAFVQADGPGQFTVELQAYNGTTSLGSVSESSDTSGDPIYIGLKDTTGININELVFSITSVSQGDPTDFAVDLVELNNTGPTPTPTASVVPTPTATPTPGGPTNTVLTYTPHKLAFAAAAFADQTGASSAPLKVKVTNPKNKTNVAVLFTSPTISDPDFVIDTNPATTTCTDGFVLNPGAHCFVGLIFQPAAVGAHSGALDILNNAHNSPQIVSLSGTGKSPGLMISRTAIAFGKVAVGTPSKTQNVTLTNKSPVPIALSSILPTGSGFSIASSTCGSTLGHVAGSNSCVIGVIFTPGASGAAAGALTITDDARHSPQKITLSGRGK